VTVLARGQRALDLQTHGIVLENAATRARGTTPVTVLEHWDVEAGCTALDIEAVGIFSTFSVVL
jgi:hypothetical protein